VRFLVALPIVETDEEMRQVVLLFVTMTAIPCGILMISAQDGRLLLLDPHLIEHSLFRTYLVPGIALTTVGLTTLVAFVVARRGGIGANRWAIVSGAMMIAFELVQIAVIQQFHVLQVVYLICGALIILGKRSEVRS